MTEAPVMHVLAGPNGAGKTSLYESTLKRWTDAEFVNADRLVGAVLGRHALTREEAELGQRLANERRDLLLSEGASFITESTFSHVSKVQLVRDAQQCGFDVVIYHVSVDSADLAVARVGERHVNGGHPVPETNIRQRFARNRGFIREAMLIAEAGFVFDNSVMGQSPRRLITFSAGQAVSAVADLPGWALEVYASELNPWPEVG